MSLSSLSLFRKSNPPPQSNDDLWRLWYLGLQSVTLSVSILATPTNQTTTPTPPFSSLTDTPTRESGDDPSLPPRVTIETPPPSEQDQIQVLGVYSNHRVTPRMNESR